MENVTVCNDETSAFTLIIMERVQPQIYVINFFLASYLHIIALSSIILVFVKFRVQNKLH
jgi:hypothetical protein